jgi:hypothetical protein
MPNTVPITPSPCNRSASIRYCTWAGVWYSWGMNATELRQVMAERDRAERKRQSVRAVVIASLVLVAFPAFLIFGLGALDALLRK